MKVKDVMPSRRFVAGDGGIPRLFRDRSMHPSRGRGFLPPPCYASLVKRSEHKKGPELCPGLIVLSNERFSSPYQHQAA